MSDDLFKEHVKSIDCDGSPLQYVMIRGFSAIGFERHGSAAEDAVEAICAIMEMPIAERDDSKRLLYRSFISLGVLKTMLTKAGLERGAAVAGELSDEIVARYPEFPALSSLRMAGIEKAEAQALVKRDLKKGETR